MRARVILVVAVACMTIWLAILSMHQTQQPLYISKPASNEDADSTVVLPPQALPPPPPSPTRQDNDSVVAIKLNSDDLEKPIGMIDALDDASELLAFIRAHFFVM